MGPESAKAHPGPVCYRKNGYLAVTDANLFLGRLLPQYFPKIFGHNENESLDYEASKAALTDIAKQINECDIKLVLLHYMYIYAKKYQ